MNTRKTLCMILALMLALASLALAESDDLQAQLDAANARVAELEAQLEKVMPIYESQVVAEYGDGNIILLEDARPQYQSMVQMYGQYGIDVSQFADDIKQNVLTAMVQEAVVQDKAKELGLDQIDASTLAELNGLAQEDLDKYIEYYGSYFTSSNATDEENHEAIIEGLAKVGYTLDAMLQTRLENYITEQVVDYVTRDITVSEDDVKAEYDAKLEEAKSSFTEDYSYNSTRTSGGIIAWNPEGYRAVKHVLIKFTDEQDTLYRDLRDNLEYLQDELDLANDPEARAEYEKNAQEAGEEIEPQRSVEEIEADMGKTGAELEALYAQLLPRAQEVVDAFNNGTSFDELINTYGEDPGMEQEPAASQGYAVSEKSDYWEEAFVKGAMSIPEIGGISEPVRGSNGIHIIYYLADITPGEVDFESLRDALEASALDNLKTNAYNEQLKQWVEEAAPVYHVDRFE